MRCCPHNTARRLCFPSLRIASQSQLRARLRPAARCLPSCRFQPATNALPSSGGGEQPAAMSGQRTMENYASTGLRSVASAADRNKVPILAVLKEYLGKDNEGLVLEVASGTGQHVAHFAADLPALTFQPTEFSRQDHSSIAAWTEGLPNVRAPMFLDASQSDTWGVTPQSCRAVFCANMCHISPWAATTGLLAGAASVLQPGGHLFIYGPFSVNGRPTTESNATFDRTLRARNAQWGYRDVEDVVTAAKARGLQLLEQRKMPANNLLLVFEK